MISNEYVGKRFRTRWTTYSSGFQQPKAQGLPNPRGGIFVFKLVFCLLQAALSTQECFVGIEQHEIYYLFFFLFQKYESIFCCIHLNLWSLEIITFLFVTQLLPVAPLHRYSMGKWKDLIIAGVPAWVTAVQKAISYLTQLSSPVRVEEFGGETSHNVCVSFQGTVVLVFTKATISCLGLQSLSHCLKKTSARSGNIWPTAGFSLLLWKSIPCYKIEWLCPFKVIDFFLSPRVTSISYYLIGLITICLTEDLSECSEFDLWWAWLKFLLKLFLSSSLFPFPLTGENKDPNT